LETGKKITLRWHYAATKAPQDKQEVLICCNGHYNVAVFESECEGFKLRGGAIFRISDYSIQWMNLIPPVALAPHSAE
jgi:hypothetical protein